MSTSWSSRRVYHQYSLRIFMRFGTMRDENMLFRSGWTLDGKEELLKEAHLTKVLFYFNSATRHESALQFGCRSKVLGREMGNWK